MPEKLQARIENIYEAAGYATGSELVRDAVRRWVKQLEEELTDEDQLEYPEFEYGIISNDKQITLDLSPRDESDLRIADGGGKNSMVPTLYTGTTEIKNRTMKPALEAIEGVQSAMGLTHTDTIAASISPEEDRDIEAVVDEIFRTIDDVIQEKEDPVFQVRRAAAKNAVAKGEDNR